MEENISPIASENAQRLAALSSIFCTMNNIPVTAELVPLLTDVVLSNIARWYSERGHTFDPKKDRIEDDALVEAFGRVQEIAILASLAAMTGVGPESFMEM